MSLMCFVQLQSAISPDATHIISGSSDGNAYIWQVSFPTLWGALCSSFIVQSKLTCLFEPGEQTA